MLFEKVIIATYTTHDEKGLVKCEKVLEKVGVVIREGRDSYGKENGIQELTVYATKENFKFVMKNPRLKSLDTIMVMEGQVELYMKVDGWLKPILVESTVFLDSTGKNLYVKEEENGK